MPSRNAAATDHIELQQLLAIPTLIPLFSNIALGMSVTHKIIFTPSDDVTAQHKLRESISLLMPCA